MTCLLYFALSMLLGAEMVRSEGFVQGLLCGAMSAVLLIGGFIVMRDRDRK